MASKISPLTNGVWFRRENKSFTQGEALNNYVDLVGAIWFSSDFHLILVQTQYVPTSDVKFNQSQA